MNKNEYSDDETEDSERPQRLSHVQKMAKKFEKLAQCDQEPVVCPKRSWQYQRRTQVEKFLTSERAASSRKTIAEETELNAYEHGPESENISLPAVGRPAEEDKGCTRVQWLARKFEFMASAKYRTVSEQMCVASIESSKRSSIERNELNEKLVVSTDVFLVNNIDQIYSEDDQDQEDAIELLEYEIQSEIRDIYEEVVRRPDSVMSETNSINDGSTAMIEKINANVAMFFYEKEQRNSHNADDGSIKLSDAIEEEPPEIIKVKNTAIYQSSEKDEDNSDYEDFSDSSEFDSDVSDEEAEAVTEPMVPPVPVSQVPHIVQELLGNEMSYIQTLNKGIENYIRIYDQEKLPPLMHGQKHHIFGNIDRIKDFHEAVFYPRLQECGTDVEKICQSFCGFIQEDYFYPYILYAINRKRSERLCVMNKQYFQARQNEMHDKLGINSFLVQPIQRLPKYQLLLSQLIKELGKTLDEDGVKDKIAACCRAEKDIQRLLDRVNNSMSINDIEDCAEIKLLYQGKFLFLNEFDFADADLKRRYRGKVFFFEKCIVYTEILDKTTLQFRGYFLYTDIGIAFEEGKTKFFLYHTKRGNKEIECTSDFKTIQFWTEHLAAMMMKSLEAKKKGKDNRDSGISDISSSTPQYVMVRNSVISGQSSNSSSGNSMAWTSGISATSSGSYESDSRRTTWYTNTGANLVSNGKTLERLMNSERHYIQILSTYMKTYLLRIPDMEKTHQIAGYIHTVSRIIDFHKQHHYPALKDCHRNIIEICEVFRSSLKNVEFVETYQLYAAHSFRAYQVLDEVFKESGIRNYTNIPVEHLNRCHTFLEHLMIELKEADDTFVSDEFKAVAVTEVMFNKFRNRVIDNLRLNSINGSPKNIVEEFGLVERSDPVGVYGYKHRLLLLQRGLVCVKSKISTKTNREKFTELVFCIPLSAVRTIESNQNPARLKFFASYAKDIIFKLDFSTKNIKETMQSEINVFQHMSV